MHGDTRLMSMKQPGVFIPCCPQDTHLTKVTNGVAGGSHPSRMFQCTWHPNLHNYIRWIEVHVKKKLTHTHTTHKDRVSLKVSFIFCGASPTRMKRGYIIMWEMKNRDEEHGGESKIENE